MKTPNKHISYLWQQYVSGEATVEEVNQLFQHIRDENNDDENIIYFQKAIADHKPAVYIDPDVQMEMLKEILNSKRIGAPPLKENVFAIPPASAGPPPPPLSRTYFLKTTWFRYAAAILLIVGVVAYFQSDNPKTETEKSEIASKRSAATDVAPGGNRAILILADGSAITLDSSADGMLAQQGNTDISKLSDGQIMYAHKGDKSKEAMMNTVLTPKGGQYKLTLSDGTKVWLNAASSIRFPAAFTGSERRVQVAGEAYFEIAALPAGETPEKIPFIVQIIAPHGKGGEIRVLGTHFNVNAYSDDAEAVIKTTLLEGSVKIIRGDQSSLLSPGQQARLDEDGKIKLIKNANLEEAVAWKNGYFQFESADLTAVLREAARWYDLEIVFEGKVPKDKFTGRIGRSVNLSRLLKWMEWSDVNFEIEGKKITVKQ